MSLDVNRIRKQFPALQSDAIFFDNPAGTQVPQQVLERMHRYMTENNANHGGAFRTSRESDALIFQARQAAADFLNAPQPETIVFGSNMTSLTFHLSRSLAHWIEPGDKIVVTRLDHDANITPWTIIAQERGADVIWVDFNPEDGRLNMTEMAKAIEQKPRILAVGYASNALGTINPVKKIIQMAHQVNALTYIDAVQYAPHGPIDVQALDCDFLVCSAYKFFGPHVGVLYGKQELLERLPAYKVRPAPEHPPEKFETGTGNFEGYAGVLGALEYLAAIGQTYGINYAEKYNQKFEGRKLVFKQAMAAIRAYEFELSRKLITTLQSISGIRIYGITDVRHLEERVPTVSFTMQNMHPRHIANALDKQGIYVWDGNYYALAVTERLGLEEHGGMVRVGPVHYNTVDEIERLGAALNQLV